MKLIFTNARVFDGEGSEYREGLDILVDKGVIREISETPITFGGAERLDVGGRALLPGLIDAHVHVYGSHVDLNQMDSSGSGYRAAHAVRMLQFALECGFTTVRDVGGGDWSIARAIRDRVLRAPRFLYAGKAISMTGGHGDFRSAAEHEHRSGYCSCGDSNTFCVIADGVVECLKAVREELRRGAHCIKIMASGGVASANDPIWMSQFRSDEIVAIVNETAERRTYTSAHCHPSEAVRRCVDLGVRVIEHGTLIDDSTARFVAERGAYIVPTMAIIFALSRGGREIGLSAESQEKAQHVFNAALRGLEHMRAAGTKVGFGTDLLGQTYTQQCQEFLIRREVFSPLEILRQATSINAALLQLSGKLGCVREGAFADIIIVDGDPLEDVGVLADNGRNIRVIMRAGELLRNELS